MHRCVFLRRQAGEPATEIRILPASRRGPLITRSAAYPENFANRLARSEATATLWRNCPGTARGKARYFPRVSEPYQWERTSGIAIEPSSRTLFSSRAAKTRGIASPEPFSVWTKAGFPPADLNLMFALRA